MKKSILLAALCSTMAFAALPTQANDKVQTTYNAAKYQQVCKGKTQGADVSFAAHGIIWNGTCQVQFFPSAKTTSLSGTESELSSICTTNPDSTTINIKGVDYKGKCALGYAAISPAHP